MLCLFRFLCGKFSCHSRLSGIFFSEDVLKANKKKDSEKVGMTEKTEGLRTDSRQSGDRSGMTTGRSRSLLIVNSLFTNRCCVTPLFAVLFCYSNAVILQLMVKVIKQKVKRLYVREIKKAIYILYDVVLIGASGDQNGPRR